MPNTDSATESKSHLHLHRVLEDEYVIMHGPLPKAYPWLFLLNHVKRVKCLANKLHDAQNGVSNRLRSELERLGREFAKEAATECESDAESNGDARPAGFGKDESELLKRLGGEAEPFPAGRELTPSERAKWTRALAGLLNRLLEDPELYDKNAFCAVSLPDELREAAGRLNGNTARTGDVARLNRLLLEHAYPDELTRIYDSELKHVPAGIRDRLVNNAEVVDLQKKEQDKMHAIRLAAIYSLLHKEERSALCLSGGGVRSATFNLGFLQGLARHRLLPKFDYLSTVSGGGYIGSWLSAWIYREHGGENAVSKELGRKPDSALDPEPKPVSYLRDYGNHQSPRVGVLSADFWTLMGVYMRNLFLNWLSFVPLLMAALMLPRIGVAMVWRSLGWQMPVLWLGFLTAAVSAAYTAVSLPSSGKFKFTASEHMRKCMLPLIASALLFAAYWVCGNPDSGLYAVHAVTGAMAVGLTGLVAYVAARARRRYNPKCYSLWKALFLIAGAVVLVTLASTLTGLLGYKIMTNEAWRLARRRQNADARVFVTFGVPALLMLYIFGGTLCAGLTSRWTGEDDQEWWARSGASIFLFIVGWIVVCSLVLFFPEYLFKSWANLFNSWNNIHVSGLPAALGVTATAVGVVSGLFTLLVGFSGKTRARAPEPGGGVPFVQSASKLAAPVFFGFLIVVVAAFTNWVMYGFVQLNDAMKLGYDQLRVLPEWLAPTLRLPDWVFSLAHNAAALTPTDHLSFLQHTSMRQCLALFVLLMLFGWVMGMIIDSNKFSLHSYYGNRLKRTYLGASRGDREGNKFTGFDNCDNIQMHELRPTWVHRKSFKGSGGDSLEGLDRVIERVNRNGHDDPVSRFIHRRLVPEVRALLDTHDTLGPASGRLRNAFIHELNRLVEEESFPLLEAGRMHPHVAPLVERGAQGESRVYLNRLILQSAYGEEMNQYDPPKLFHVVCMALNLAWSKKLAWQERKAETFTASPLHSGNLWLGYRRSRHYGGDSGISLGTAFTVSGAAANPNMGYMLSSPLASFLMSMFNVRLGWWLGNPAPAGDRTFQRDVPKFVLGPVVQEALSLADDTKRYVYLSDGGHFENLGLYEMVLRRCRLIVVSDASTDAGHSFESLGVAIRKIRIDLGVPIEFEEFRFAGPDDGDGTRGRHCAVAKVRYSCVDEDGTDGVLVYIKPSLSGNEPRDILNYHVSNRKFPQDPIADQFFDEPQFESYRMLGSHIIEDICGEECNGLSLCGFVNRAYRHWGEEKQKYTAPWMERWLRVHCRNGDSAEAAFDGARKAPKVLKESRHRRTQGQNIVVNATPPGANGKNGKNGHKVVNV